MRLNLKASRQAGSAHDWPSRKALHHPGCVIRRLLSTIARRTAAHQRLFLPVISKTHHTAQTFSVKSSVVYCRTDAAAFLVANEIITRRLRALTGAGEAALDPVLIHKHRARGKSP